MKDLLTYIAQNLVEHPQAVDVQETETDGNVVLELRVDPSDMGKVIGRQGRIAKEIRTLGSLPGTVTLLQIDPNGYTVQRLLYQENGMYAIYDADGGYRVFRAEDRLQYGAGVGHAAA